METGAGLLRVSVEAVGEEDLDPRLPIAYGSTGLWTLVVPVRSLDAIRRELEIELPHD
jgi:predicted PhzF superfamily epimerase YddE/YHI9